MTVTVPQSTEKNVENIYFSPDKVNFSALIQAAGDAPVPSYCADGHAIDSGFMLGNAPFISRNAFDRSYHRFSAFLAAPPHRPTVADPRAEALSYHSEGKINLDSV